MNGRLKSIHKLSITIILILIGGAARASGPTVPGPVKMIRDAVLIFEGDFKIVDYEFVVDVKKVYKGDVEIPTKKRLVLSKSSRTWYVVNRIKEMWSGKRCIVLSKRSNEGERVHLTWSIFSIWPIPSESALYVGDNIEKCGAFITEVMKLDNIGKKNVGLLVKTLHDSMNTELGRKMALGFLDGSFKEYIYSTDDERYIKTILIKRLLELNVLDKGAVETVSKESGQVCIVVAIRYLVIAGIKNKKPIRSSSLKKIKDILSMHGVVGKNAKIDIEEVEAILQEKGKALVRREAMKFLGMFDSGIDTVRNEGNSVMKLILGSQFVEEHDLHLLNDHRSARKFWEKQIRECWGE
jgi:hypothetical protein